MRWITLSLVSLFVCVQSATAQTNLGAVSVGSSSSASYSVEFLYPGTLGAITATTGGKQDLDFSATGDSCHIGSSYTFNATCTVKVTFKPTLAGPRYGSVMLTSQTGYPLAELFVSGTGQAPQASFSPAPQTQLLGNTSSYYAPEGLATDSGGNAYAVIGTYQPTLSGGEPVYGSVLKLPGSINADGMTANYPTDLSVDGAGNTYIHDFATGVSVLTPSGSYGWSHIPTGNFGLADSYGNLYKTCATGLCKESLTFGGTYAESTVSSISPSLLFVSGAGDLFAAASTGGAQAIYKFTSTGDSYIETTVASGLPAVNALTADTFGNVYFVDGSTNVYKEALQPDASYTKSLLFTGAVTQYTVNFADHSEHSSAANRLAVDPAGNLYYWKKTGTVASSSPNPSLPATQVPVYGLFEAAYSQPASVTFPQTTQYTLSAPQTVTITNSGNLPLEISSFTIPEAFQQDPNSKATCANALLPPGESCTTSILFRPLAFNGTGSSATVTESLKITTNTGNVPGTQQAITLTGVELAAVAPTPVISVGPINSSTGTAIVSISTSNPAAKIYYTLDESQPTTSSPRYTGPFPAGNGTAIKAISTLTGYLNSPLAVNFVGNLPPYVANPVFSLPQGVNYYIGQSLTISDSTPGAQISYTIKPFDGSAVSTGSGLAPLTLTLKKSEQIMATACVQYYACPTPVIAAYTLYSATPILTFSRSGAVDTVTLTTATPAQVIYYTTNGSAPAYNSAQYGGPFTVPSGTIVTAMTDTSYMVDSKIVSATAP